VNRVNPSPLARLSPTDFRSPLAAATLPERNPMFDALTFVLILVGWWLLQWKILPRFGVAT
jgi:hypothetical protein